MTVRAFMACGAMLLASSAVAQTATHAGAHNPAVKNNDAAHVAAPAKGANSFSEDQARGRLTKATSRSRAWRRTGMAFGAAARPRPARRSMSGSTTRAT